MFTFRTFNPLAGVFVRRTHSVITIATFEFDHLYYPPAWGHLKSVQLLHFFELPAFILGENVDSIFFNSELLQKLQALGVLLVRVSRNWLTRPHWLHLYS